ncbi:MAG: LiaF-related protein [Spirochaetia bacterium]|nr:LiaF-related protein [Spirochaetia bacterium]
MGIIFTGVFWGVFLILVGISVLIKIFFNIDFPVFRIIFGLLFILIGVNILTGRHLTGRHISWTDSGNVVFSEGRFTGNNTTGKYNVIFGKAETDLSDLPKGDSSSIEINTIFGDNTVYIKKGMTVLVKANSAFAQTDLPDASMAAFGTSRFTTPEYDPKKPFTKIALNTVFGATRVRYKE